MIIVKGNTRNISVILFKIRALVYEKTVDKAKVGDGRRTKGDRCALSAHVS